MNILLLCTYPIAKPMHGGQLRVRNIVDAYRAAGHTVDVIGVLGSESYEKEEGFQEYPGDSILSSLMPDTFLMEDYLIGQLYFENNFFYNSLINSINIKPDIVHVEQPWLFRFAKKFLSSTNNEAKIIYGSQNIEWELKMQILSSYTNQVTAKKFADLIRDVEFEAISKSDAIICVSEDDKRKIEKNTSVKVYLAPNGVNESLLSMDGLKEASVITNGYKYAIYCASAHPPNMTGFFNIFAGGFGCLKPDERLVIAGGAGLAIKKDPRLNENLSLKKRILIAGLVSKKCLENLIDSAQCIVLPLTQGGGTNLKTAEAIWAGKYIVATTVAMRGFENFLHSRGVFVEDDPSAFKRKIREVMGMPPLQLTNEEKSNRRSVLWGSTLSILPIVIENIFQENRSYE